MSVEEATIFVFATIGALLVGVIGGVWIGRFLWKTWQLFKGEA